jgi:hypothetical protein
MAWARSKQEPPNPEVMANSGANSQAASGSELTPPPTEPGGPLTAAFQIRVEQVVRAPNTYAFIGVVEQGTVRVPCNVRRLSLTPNPDSGTPIPISRADFERKRAEEVPMGTKAAFELSYPPEAVEKRPFGASHAPVVANIYGLEKGDLLVNL